MISEDEIARECHGNGFLPVKSPSGNNGIQLYPGFIGYLFNGGGNPQGRHFFSGYRKSVIPNKDSEIRGQGKPRFAGIITGATNPDGAGKLTILGQYEPDFNRRFGTDRICFNRFYGNALQWW